MKLAKKTPNKTNGFTLVELLVVIVIVVTLASLAFFGGSRALARSKEAQSTHNLRQLYTSMQVRMQEQIPNKYHRVGQYMPAAGQVSAQYGADSWGQYNWISLLGEVEGYCKIGGGDPKWSIDGSSTFFQSPYAEDLDLSTRATTSDTIGYAYHYTLGGWVAPHTQPSQTRNFVRVPSRVNNPSSLICFIETGGSDEWRSANGNFNDIIANWTIGELPPIEGRKGYNVIYVDGSAGLIKVSENNSDFNKPLNLNYNHVATNIGN